jgi:mitochondrial fission protein ELM1
MKNQNNETPYRALVGMAAKAPQNRIVITSDSVSMPCEIARIVPSQQIYLYPVSNLNRQNREFVRWMYATGRAGKVNAEHGTEEYLPGPVHSLMEAAGQIAQAALQII